ncbi:MAG: hypothetical protein A3B68_06585 [Candidatus Melainabacteria bacterium RIFCSPHIGHO2_02_FULL_34_12]|nr:MAG: hypothetical protein A3B68_06585 [Candidatus Melainabacteria bacterium RIFCSPHIGHO2_02_FULL_34_12]
MLFSAFLYLSIMPSYAEDPEDPCVEKCKSAEYSSGHISEEGTSSCNENEDVVETICCCSPKK